MIIGSFSFSGSFVVRGIGESLLQSAARPGCGGAYRSVNQEIPEKVCTAMPPQMKFSGIDVSIMPQN
jgi:hypothetical protein